MDGRYAMVTTREERIAVAVMSAQLAYKREFPNGVTAGVIFMAAYLRPFIDRECLQAQLDELHRPARILAPREMDLTRQLAEMIATCQKKIDQTSRS